MEARISSDLSQAELQADQKVDSYTLLERLNYGGESVVWSAWDERRERVVAIKFLSAGGANSLSDSSAFKHHVQLVTTLHHPHVLPIYDSGEFGSIRYMVMRYASSGSLHQKLMSGALPIEETFRLAGQVAAGLDYIHSHNIVHRDLKPGNILLDARGNAYLTDFGLAKRLSQTTQQLHTGHGTAPYSSPEQITRATLKRESDIYSMGILLFEMFTGDLPWEGEIALAVQQLNAAEELPDPREINPALPAALTDALRVLTAANSEARPASALGAFRLVEQAMAGAEGVQERSSSDVGGVQAVNLQAPHDEIRVIVDDTKELVRQAMAASGDPSAEKFKLQLTNFALAHSVYGQAERYGVSLTDTHIRFMLWGALTHGRYVSYWWDKLTDPQVRLQMCEQTITGGDETAVGWAVTQLLEEPTATIQSATVINRLIEMVTVSEDEVFSEKAFALLTRSVTPPNRWQPVGFSAESDSKLAALVLSNSPQAKQASRLIAQIRSEAAVQALLDARGGADAAQVLPALVEIRQVQNSLPRSIPWQIRLQVVVKLARRQLFANRVDVVRAYLTAALGSALGLGIHVYATYRAPSFLDAARILNALGSGLLFGLLIGLGIFLTRLVMHRLRVLNLASRMVVGISLGALATYLGIAGFHSLYLGATPTGGLLAIGALLIALGFGIGAGLTRSRVLQVLVSVLAIGAASGLTWVVATRTGLSPLLYYEVGRPVQTIILIGITSIVIGWTSNLVDLSKATK